MFTVTITQNETVTTHRVRSRSAIRRTLRAHIEKVGRRKAQHAHVRVEGENVKRSFRMATCAAYKTQPREAVAA